MDNVETMILTRTGLIYNFSPLDSDYFFIDRNLQTLCVSTFHLIPSDEGANRVAGSILLILFSYVLFHFNCSKKKRNLNLMFHDIPQYASDFCIAFLLRSRILSMKMICRNQGCLECCEKR
jgi:hypothetical protein